MAAMSAAVRKRLLKLLDEVPTVEAQKALRASDPEKYADYLKALDLKHGPRDVRAKDMGFGDKTWYHGTSVPIDEFKNEAKGLSTGAQSAKKGFFFAKDPVTASQYADLANEKGVIREGDNVTTRWLSEKETPVDIAEKELKELESEIRLSSPGKLQFGNYNAKTDGVILNGNRYSSIDEIDAAIKRNQANIAKFPEDAEYLGKRIKALESGKLMLGSKENQLSEMLSKKKGLEDIIQSGGQNVLPVRLKGSPLVKNYKGESYRDETYADLMNQATEQGKDSVLFKNTYDAADPNNKVKTDIAAVFEPNQIRSKNAAYDPRFKDSADIMSLREAGEGQGMRDVMGEVLNKMAAPQRWAFDKAAKAMGVESDPEDSEKTAFNIVDRGTERLGIPEDSTIGNMGKAAAVAGLEVFGDPTNAIPMGAISKGAKGAKGLLKESKMGAAIENRINQLRGLAQ